MPENAATGLQETTKPLADTERYDRLRGGSLNIGIAEEVDHA